MYILQNYRIKAVFDITEPLKDPEKWVEEMKRTLREDCEEMNKEAIKALKEAHRDELLAKYFEGNDCQISIDGTKLCVTLNDKCISDCYSDTSVGIDFTYDKGWVEERDIQEWFLHFFEREYDFDDGWYKCNDDFNIEKEKLKISTLSVDYENEDIMHDKWEEAEEATYPEEEDDHERSTMLDYRTTQAKKRQWSRLISINEKACSAINNIKRLGNTNESNSVELSLGELYEIAGLTGNHATILMRQIKSQEGNHDKKPYFYYKVSELYFDDEQKAVDYLNTCDNGEIEKVIIESPCDLNYSDGCTLDDLIATEGSCDIYRRLYIPYQPPHENELSDEEVEH